MHKQGVLFDQIQKKQQLLSLLASASQGEYNMLCNRPHFPMPFHTRKELKYLYQKESYISPLYQIHKIENNNKLYLLFKFMHQRDFLFSLIEKKNIILTVAMVMIAPNK